MTQVNKKVTHALILISAQLAESNCTIPKRFIVGERLFDTQCYKALDNAGPTGMTFAVSCAVYGVV